MNHYIGITKEIKEKKRKNEDFEETAQRLNSILDDLDMNAVTVEPTGYIWGKGKERGYHSGIKISYAIDCEGFPSYPDLLKLGALFYGVNKEFAGAKAMITIDGVTIPFYPGSHSE